MSDDFLPRAHSKRLGELERSNWKSLRDGRNIHRIDPAIREIVSLLNNKGYRTFSSCSGGHPTNPRWKVNRHESGYLAFSPPSNVAFALYLGLRKKNRDFTVEAQAVIDDGDREDSVAKLEMMLEDVPLKEEELKLLVDRFFRGTGAQGLGVTSDDFVKAILAAKPGESGF